MQADAAHGGWAARWRENVMRLQRCGCARGDETRREDKRLVGGVRRGDVRQRLERTD
jgi:hypothetical protein